MDTKTSALSNYNFFLFEWLKVWILYSTVQVFFFNFVSYVQNWNFWFIRGKIILLESSHMGIPPIPPPPPPHSPSLGRAGRGGSKDAVGPCRSPLTVVYLCNKWNIHRGAAVTDRLHKSRGTQRAFQTSLCTWLTSVTRTTKLGLGPVDIQITSTIVQLFLEHHWWQ